MHTCQHFNNLDEEDQLRIWEAVDKLCKNNPDVVKQMEHLAEIKETKPIIWQMGLKFLKL